MKKVILINGSPAEQSHTGVLLAHLSELFLDNDVEAEIVNLSKLSLGINDPLLHHDPGLSKNKQVREFAEAISKADIVVLGTPLYHGSFSGLLKSALDHLVGDAFKSKKIALVCNASGSRNSVQAAQALILVARTMEGEVAHTIVGTCKADYELVAGELELCDKTILKRCDELVDELLA